MNLFPSDKEPNSMDEAVRAKAHAEKILSDIEEDTKLLRTLKKDWKKRYDQCLKAISKFAKEKE